MSLPGPMGLEESASSPPRRDLGPYQLSVSTSAGKSEIQIGKSSAELYEMKKHMTGSNHC